MLRNTFLIFILLKAYSMPLFAQEIPNPEQFVLLLKASSERYQTYSAKIHLEGYRNGDSPNKSELVYTQEVLCRVTSDKSYFEIQLSSYEQINDSGIPENTTRIYSINQQWSKGLLVESKGKTLRGQIKPGRLLENAVGVTTVKDAMWDFFRWPLEQADMEASSVVFDEKSNQYIATYKMGSPEKGPYIKLHVDPSKGFIPIKKQLLKHDGSVFISFENSDFNQTKEGLWIPLKFTLVDLINNLTIHYVVQEVMVNEPIADELFELSFPSGTIVKDDIAGLKYVVNDTDMALNTLDDSLNDNEPMPNRINTKNSNKKDGEALLKKEDLGEAKHAKEEDLVKAATDAQKLISLPKQNKTPNYIYYIVIVALVLFAFASFYLYKMLKH